MNAIILSDVHQKLNWKKIMRSEGQFDKVFFVGDYFDHHGDAEVQGEAAVNNFLEIIEFKKQHPDKVFLCIGNHDLHYLEGFESISNFQPYNYDIFRKALEDNLEYLNIAYEYEGYIISHAGVSAKWYEGCLKTAQNKNYPHEGTPLEVINGWFDLYKKTLNEIKEMDANGVWNINEDPCWSKSTTLRDIARFFSFSDSCLDPYGDDPSQPPTWIRPGALISNAMFDMQVVGHTGIEVWFGVKGDVPFAARLVDEKEGIDNRVIFIDNIKHDLDVVLDNDDFIWTKVGYDCMPLKEENVQA